MRGRSSRSKDRRLSESLLSAAEAALHSKSHLDLTTREIAKSAGTDVAMISYYYNNKNGLIYTLVDNLISQIVQLLNQIEKDVDKDPFDPIEQIVRGLLDAYYRHAAAVHIVLVETLRPSSSIFKNYSRQHGSETFARINRIFAKLVGRGVYSADLDTATTTWMLICLTSGPPCLQPVWRAMGHQPTELPEIGAWADYVIRVMRSELAPAKRSVRRREPGSRAHRGERGVTRGEILTTPTGRRRP